MGVSAVGVLARACIGDECGCDCSVSVIIKIGR